MILHDETESWNEASGESQRPRVVEPLVAGARVGRYVVIEKVGQGGMGVVYSAFDPQLNRKLALKLLHSRFGADDIGQRRLLREAQAMAQLRHPSVITVHDVGVENGCVYVAMEFVEGKSIREWLAESGGRRPWRDVVAVFREAAEGLVAAHDVGLVHRDFKPDNVMIDASGRARVMDFGLARASTSARTPGSLGSVPPVADVRTGDDPSQNARLRVRARLQALGRIAVVASGDASTMDARSVDPPAASSGEASPAVPLTRPGAIVGTPAYMAPEQLRGDSVDARADQFAFFVALYEALYGRRPFASDNVPQLMVAVLEARVEPPPRGISVPRWLHALVLRGLAAEPAARHPDMAHVVRALTIGAARPRRVVVAAVAVLAIAGGIAAMRSTSSVCTGAEEALGDAWTDARRTSVREGLLASGTPFVQSTATKAIEALDGYAGEWIAMHEDACLATRVRGEQSEHVLDLRMACLAGRRRTLVALGDVLAGGEAPAAERAIEGVARLPPVAACGDTETLLEGTPGLAAEGPEQERVRAALARAEAQLFAGTQAVGLRALAAVDDEVAILADDALVAEQEWIRGRLLDDAGRSDEAADALRRAAHTARASRHDVLAAEAEIELVFVTGYRTRALPEAELWADHARAAIERIGEPPVLVANLDNHLGVVLQAGGRHADALAALRRALATRERVLGPDHLDVGESHHNLGLCCRDGRDYACAREHLERATEIRRAVFGADHPRVAESMSALAGVDFFEHRNDAATAGWTAVLAIQRGAWGRAGHPQIGNTLNNLGNAAMEAGDRAAAASYFRDALAVWEATAPEHPQLEKALYSLGMLLAQDGEHARALALLQRAVTGSERKLGPSHPELGRRLVQLGLVQVDAGDPAGAVATLRRAVDILDAAEVDAETRERARTALLRALARDKH